MRAFVTGGTGFIGSHLVDYLLSSSEVDEVSCLIRNKPKWLSGKNITTVSGDLHDLNALKQGTQNADVVFHLAGVVKAPSLKKYLYDNVEATENLMRVAQKNGVKNIIVLSSLAAVGPSNGQPVDEDKPKRPISDYGKSKKQMEDLIHRVTDSDVSVKILRPSVVYGPREEQVYTYFKMAAKGISPIVGDGIHPQISMVYIADVIQAIWRAYAYEKVGVHEYFISDAHIHTWSEIRATTARVLDRRIAPIYVKPGIVQKIGSLVEKSAGIFGKYPVLNEEKTKEMIHEWTCTIEKARTELHYQPNFSLEEGITRTLHWYKQHHWL